MSLTVTPDLIAATGTPSLKSYRDYADNMRGDRELEIDTNKLDTEGLNDLIAAYCRGNTGLTYIDCRKLTLDAEGRCRPELLAPDKLHFSEEGYKLLAGAVRPYLPK